MILAVFALVFPGCKSGNAPSSKPRPLRFADTVGVKNSPFADDPEAQVVAMTSRARTDMRSLATALETYFVDNNRYPASVPPGDGTSIDAGNPHLDKMPTFRRSVPGGAMTITTPVAYISTLFRDPFEVKQGPVDTYAYNSTGNGWILSSPGPDGDFDAILENVYNPAVPQPSPELLALAYDPSNGTISDGDIFRVKQ